MTFKLEPLNTFLQHNYIGESFEDEWLVLATRTANADDIISASNFQFIMETLDLSSEFEIGDDYQLLTFGHWAAGSIDHIVIDSTKSKITTFAHKIIESLNEYPILDDDHYSNTEYAIMTDRGYIITHQGYWEYPETAHDYIINPGHKDKDWDAPDRVPGIEFDNKIERYVYYDRSKSQWFYFDDGYMFPQNWKWTLMLGDYHPDGA